MLFRSIYDHPASLFVNTFVGTTNSLSGTVIESSSSVIRVLIPECGEILTKCRTPFPVGSDVVVTGRPEHISVSDKTFDGALAGTIDAVLPVGPMFMYEIVLNNGSRIKVNQSRRGEVQPQSRGHAAYVSFSPDLCQVFPANGSGPAS